MRYIDYDYNKLINLDGNELLRATEFPFDKKDDDFTINQWFIDSGLFYYLNYQKYGKPFLKVPPAYNISSDLVYSVYVKLFEATRNQLKDHRYFKSKCPESGEFYGYKFVMLDQDHKSLNELDIGIVKLRIPKEAKRLSPYFGTGKCRCDKAFVEEIKRMKVTPCDISYYKGDNDDYVYTECGYSYYDPEFMYVVKDEPVTVKNFDENPWHECTNGIYFFMTPEEAIEMSKICRF